MYVKIRKLNAKAGDDDIINISKMSLIHDMKKLIFEETKIDVTRQRLFYKGKQLHDDCRVMDYNIQLNDVIQLMETNPNVENQSDAVTKAEKSKKVVNGHDKSAHKSGDSDSDKENEQASTSKTLPKSNPIISEVLNETNLNTLKETGISKYFREGDAIDFMNLTIGAWFEAHILNIFKVNSVDTSDNNKEPDLIFKVKMDSEEGDETIDVTLDLIRPRSYYKLNLKDLSVDQAVLINYNIENPTTRGYWYDFVIKRVNSKVLQGTLHVGKDGTQIEKCSIKFIEEVLRIEESVLLEQRGEEVALPPLRKTVYYCEVCKDEPSKRCRECGCKICAKKDEVDTIILCDECDYGYHLRCLNPPLKEVPPDPEWYCPSCKNDENEIVKAGEKLKFSKKRSKMASAKGGTTKRDWGRGMACAGRTKECTIVTKNHFGPIPGVEVGTRWMFRLQLSEWGIHRPHVAGIHGRESDGAYSLVLSGGYEDDVDNGEEFIYTGSGGRDLSQNKRVNGQSSDQVLTRMNKALALNCNAPLNEKGAEAKDWRAGKPVRVSRSAKAAKHSKYAPNKGCRYDGIYKVVKYYLERGKSGFNVWKYILRRDDPSPLPWSPEAPVHDIIYPDGYEEAQAKKEQKKEKKQGRKRNKSPDTSHSNDSESDTSPLRKKKKKMEPYVLPTAVTELVQKDTPNEKLWKECLAMLGNGKLAFLEKVKELFLCICCQEVVYPPVTTECKHNVCKACLTRSFAAEIYTCPYCRFELGEDLEISVNENLLSIMLQLFPGYEAGR